MRYKETLKSVLNAAQCAGGDLSKLPGEELYVLNVTFDDAAYKVVNNWVATQDGIRDPTVTAICAPPEGTMGTALCPPMSSWGHLLIEASTIPHHYAALTANDFAQNPVVTLPGPLATPVIQDRVLHARVVLHALYARIQDPNDPNYPAISGLPVGSYICSVLAHFPNLCYTVAIYKN
jgi:hypothetical protein